MLVKLTCPVHFLGEEQQQQQQSSQDPQPANPAIPRTKRPLPNSLLWISQRRPDRCLRTPRENLPTRGDRQHAPNKLSARQVPTATATVTVVRLRTTSKQHFSLSAPKQNTAFLGPFIELQREPPTGEVPLVPHLLRHPRTGIRLLPSPLVQIRAGSTPSRTSSEISGPRTLLPLLTGKIPPYDVHRRSKSQCSASTIFLFQGNEP
ncbi:hypothetical protein CPLU01_08840 [Colletotrichum plurivorum]|uniref:Uncharacterized protein n=1 Tax=Colletotrichum plurivorum TaxID=2175906 RepID=A0A8H6NC60_9PEZI|nr:hypothetical protein CPLU01_08840 [Colletotrichum plurivorum]